MKKYIIALLVIFSLNIYPQKLEKGITNESFIINIYDTRADFYYADYGYIQIDNKNITLFTYGENNKDNMLYLGFTDEYIAVGVNQLFFKSKPIYYYLDDKEYSINNAKLGDDVYYFKLPIKHFKEMKNNMVYLTISSEYEEETFNIYYLIQLFKTTEKYIKDYKLYKKYIK